MVNQWCGIWVYSVRLTVIYAEIGPSDGCLKVASPLARDRHVFGCCGGSDCEVRSRLREGSRLD
jgi:hypothetical protein